MTTPFPFQSAAVLTAAQMNAITTLATSTKTASHTLTIADVSTRVIMNSASATTITVNTSIFGASDVVEILNIGAGVCTVTAGSCTVGTSGSLALAQNAGGTLTFISASASVFVASGVAAAAGGLTLIKSQVIGSGVQTVTVTNAFSTTYDDYRIVISNTSISAGIIAYMTINGSTGSTYNGSGQSINYAAAVVSNDFVSATNQGFALASLLGTTFSTFRIDIFSPFLSTTTQLMCTYASNNIQSNWAGNDSNTSSSTNFTIDINGTNTYTGGTIYVYGYAKA